MDEPSEESLDEVAYAQAFAAVLRQLRINQGFSQDELAHRSGYQRNYVCHRERGEKSSSLRTIVRLARVLETTPAGILALVEQRLTTLGTG